MNDRVCLYAPFPASTNYTDMARVQIVGARHAVPGFLSDPGDVAYAFSVLCRAFDPDISESIVNLSRVTFRL